MAVSLILLEIKDAPGDATVAGYENHIVVDSFSWSVTAKTTVIQMEDPVTKIDAKAVSIKKQFDRSSTVLREMMKKPGDPSFTATLRFIDPTSRSASSTKGQGKLDALLEIELLGCHIDKISLSADDAGKEVTITEDLVLSYEKSANFTYRNYDAAKKARSSAKTAQIPPSEKDPGKT